MADDFIKREELIKEISSISITMNIGRVNNCKALLEKTIKSYCEAVLNKVKESPAIDVDEVKHGKWHIMLEDPYDESECPTQEGWYRIITVDGEEMTDYYFKKPIMSGLGVTFWKNCKKGIRAWAKMDGDEDAGSS